MATVFKAGYEHASYWKQTLKNILLLQNAQIKMTFWVWRKIVFDVRSGSEHIEKLN